MAEWEYKTTAEISRVINKMGDEVATWTWKQPSLLLMGMPEKVNALMAAWRGTYELAKSLESRLRNCERRLEEEKPSAR